MFWPYALSLPVVKINALQPAALSHFLSFFHVFVIYYLS